MPQDAASAFYRDSALGASAFHLAVELLQRGRKLRKAVSKYPLIESGLKHERHANLWRASHFTVFKACVGVPLVGARCVPDSAAC